MKIMVTEQNANTLQGSITDKKFDVLFLDKAKTNYNSEYFDEIIEDTLAQIKETLIAKGKEYRRNDDPFHNFNEGVKITGQTREDVIWGFALKHFISIQDIKNDLKQGIKPTRAMLDEKYGDLINYLLLEKASIIDKF